MYPKEASKKKIDTPPQHLERRMLLFRIGSFDIVAGIENRCGKTLAPLKILLYTGIQ